MHYDLGVGLGGSTTTAAVLRGAATGHPEVVLSEPAARGALHRVGDPVPSVTARGPRAGADVVAELVRGVVRRATSGEGTAPRAIALARPIGWGAHRDAELTAALARVGLQGVLLVPAADAAVDAAPAVRTGELIGVVDVGTGTTHAALVRRRRGRGGADGLRVTEPVRTAVGPVRFGGSDVDDAVLDHVRDAVGPLPPANDPGDGDIRRALAELRRRCVGAKEALASREEVVIDVELPGIRARVPLTGADLDARVAPLAERAATTLRDLAGADTGVDAVVLVGGTARLPLIARTVAAGFGVDARPQPDPATLLACGAARAAGVHAGRRRRGARGERPRRAVPTGRAVTTVVLTKRPPAPDGAAPAPPASVAPPTPDEDTPAVEAPHPGADVPRPAVHVAPVPDEVRAAGAPRGRGRLVLAAAAVVLALGAGAATIPVPGLTRGTSSVPVPVAGTAPAPSTTAAPVPALVPLAPAVRSTAP